MLVPLASATPGTCGGKAATLGVLSRAGFPVPDGVVVPFGVAPGDLTGVVASLGGRVAVRSSASSEDTATASAAGQYDSFLDVTPTGVVSAVTACRASLRSERAVAYAGGDPAGAMAVIIQRMVDADVSGVMFVLPDETVIESVSGSGADLVAGRVDPARVRGDLDGDLVELGRAVSTLLGAPQDIEWAIAERRVWLLQSRPVTAPLPPAARILRQPAAPPPPPPSWVGHTMAPGYDISAPAVHSPATATPDGTPGSRGTATGPARIVHGPDDFPRVRPGDILICRYTDPAWTPLLRIVSGVVTETGGILSHAAIVAREYGIPAVLAVPGAMSRFADGTPLSIDGAAGTVSPHARCSEDGR